MPRSPFSASESRLLGGAALLALASSCGGRSTLEDYGGLGGGFEWVDSLPPTAGAGGSGAAGGAGSGGASNQGGSGGSEPPDSGVSGSAGSEQGGSGPSDAGIGNGDAAPPVDAGPRINLIPNPGFEAGHADWRTFGPAGSVLADVPENPHGGDLCLATRERSASSSGPLLDITSLLLPCAARYEVSAWVRIPSGSATASVSARIRCQDTITAYVPVAAGAVSGEWAELSGQFTMPSCTLASLSLFVEGPPPGVDLLLDDVALFAVED